MSFRVLATSGLKVTHMNNVRARLMSTGTPLASKIGFIGLGNMGGHMVNNLIKQVRRHEYEMYIYICVMKVNSNRHILRQAMAYYSSK